MGEGVGVDPRVGVTVGVGTGVGVGVAVGKPAGEAVEVAAGVGDGVGVGIGSGPVQPRAKASTAKLMSRDGLGIIASQISIRLACIPATENGSHFSPYARKAWVPSENFLILKHLSISPSIWRPVDDRVGVLFVLRSTGD